MRLAGYAALFEVPDAARDVIRKGAFARALLERAAAGEPLPLYWQHRPRGEKLAAMAPYQVDEDLMARARSAQKEFAVNEAHALTDALLHTAIEGEASAPPKTAADGDCWLVSAAPSGAWIGRAQHLACRQAGSWLFIAPRHGMRIFDKATGQDLRYRGVWQRPSAPAAASGGTVIDAEARAAISALTAKLVTAGILVMA